MYPEVEKEIVYLLKKKKGIPFSTHPHILLPFTAGQCETSI